MLLNLPKTKSKETEIIVPLKDFQDSCSKIFCRGDFLSFLFFRLVTSDLAFFKESLKSLSGTGDVNKSLEDLWRRVNALKMNRGSPSTGRKNTSQR